MSKAIIIVSSTDYTNIVTDIISAQHVLGKMRQTKKRDQIEFLLERALSTLSKDDVDTIESHPLNSNLCVSCGRDIPEGRLVCPLCEEGGL